MSQIVLSESSSFLEILKKLKIIENKIFCAGPCAVESYEQLYSISAELIKQGANLIRAGAFKPRTSPYSFQGLGSEGVKIIKRVSVELKVPFVSEITDLKYLDLFIENIDLIQVGSRSMYNTELLKELGKTKKPILLKRGLSATYKEWLNAAEYILLEGNSELIMCERGIRSFDSFFRNTLDLSAVPYIKQFLPIMVDVSHACGKPEFMEPLCYASFAAGADGVMLEVHNNPDKALCDAEQAINTETFALILNNSKKLLKTLYDE